MKQNSHSTSVILILTLFLCITSIETVYAQRGRGLGIATFQPSTSVNSIFEMSLPIPQGHLDWSAGAFFHYSHEPMRRELSYVLSNKIEEETFPVARRFGGDISFALGLFDVAEIGLGVPVILYQKGEGPDPGGSIQTAGVGDPRIEIKARIAEVGTWNFGVGGTFTLPLGHYASSGRDIMGYRLPSAEPRLMFSGVLGPILIAANVGFLVRSKETLDNYDQNHALTWNGALAFDIFDFEKPGGVRLALETIGEAGIDFDTLVEVPMEIVYGVKIRFPKDMIFQVGSSVALTNGVGSPAFRIFAGIMHDGARRSCPAGMEDFDGFEDDDNCVDPDNDQDQIMDALDACPNDPEDMDGFQDDDGCPDNDNDGDNIPDSRDKCPMLDEDFDDFEDNDGCPEEGPGKPMVKITDTHLLISSKIYFDYDKATINEVSYSILDAVGDALLANPHIRKVRIEGHSDNEGNQEYNLSLSKKRAESVMKYLENNKNVPPERLTFKGYGFSKPKASNDTDEGKAINRRVEFTILGDEEIEELEKTGSEK